MEVSERQPTGEEATAEFCAEWTLIDSTDCVSDRSFSDRNAVEPVCATGSAEPGASLVDAEVAQETLSEGAISPKSDDMAADMVLGEPFQAHPGVLQAALREGPLEAHLLRAMEAALRSQAAGSRARAAEPQLAGEPELAVEPELAALQGLARLSQEGSLEGFAGSGSASAQLPEQQQREQQGQQGQGGAKVTSVAAAAASAWLASAGAVAGGMVQEVREEWGELRLLLGEALGAAHARVEDVKDVAAVQSKRLRQQVAKALHSPPPSLVMVSLGAVTALAVVYIGHLWLVNHNLAVQLKQRDRDLARLVLRIMNLQEALQSSRAVVPVLRHTSLQPAFAISSLA